MKKFEYKEETIEELSILKKIEYLNKKGEDSWELIKESGEFVGNRCAMQVTFLFKRELLMTEQIKMMEELIEWLRSRTCGFEKKSVSSMDVYNKAIEVMSKEESGLQKLVNELNKHKAASPQQMELFLHYGNQLLEEQKIHE